MSPTVTLGANDASEHARLGFGEQAGWLVDWLAGGLLRSLSGWLAGWLAGGLADWLGGRRVNSLPMYAVNAMAHVRTLEQNSGCEFQNEKRHHGTCEKLWCFAIGFSR